MEALMLEMSASEPRERLLAFVDRVVRRCRMCVSARTRLCMCGG
jgi:hypothetical protein